MIILIKNVRFMFFIMCCYALLTSAKRSHLSFVFISMNAEYGFHNPIKFYHILTKNKDYRKWSKNKGYRKCSGGEGNKHLPPVIYFHGNIIIKRGL